MPGPTRDEPAPGAGDGTVRGAPGQVGPDLPAPSVIVTVAGVGGVGLVCDVWDGARSGVVLVHGLASNARLWDGVAAELWRLGSAVCTVDLRGHGRSDKPDTGYDMATVADDLVAVLDYLHRRDPRSWRRPVVAGQSWGGNVVVELAARHPSAVCGVVGVDGGVIELAERFADPDDVRRVLAPPAIAGMPGAALERAIRQAHPGWTDLAIAGTMANVEWRPDGTVAPWLTLDRHLQVLDGLWAHRPSEVFPHLVVPVLLLMVDDGHADGWAAGKRSAVERAVAGAGTGARVRWFAPADHDVHAQQPVAVAEEIASAVAQWSGGD